MRGQRPEKLQFNLTGPNLQEVGRPAKECSDGSVKYQEWAKWIWISISICHSW
ncbi:MAG: hypothetical protein P0107_05300 [Nitrosomonas sp.]|nr:hypothetical protein [Nitrosomonas sp.]